VVRLIESIFYLKIFFLLLIGFKNVHTVPSGAMVTMDYRTDRVRVYVDQQGKVVAAPGVG
jgi:hypothetical protein